jgi:tetratricopeptide (TPR) repeat protein
MLRKILLLVLVTLGVPALLLAILEGTLRCFGYGYATTYFIKSHDGRSYCSNRQFGWQFFPHESAIVPNPALFPVHKEPGTRRIFILGESAAAGMPTPSFGFGRILQTALEENYPHQRFEVINAAMRGINSSIILRIAEECAAYEPDLFLIYMGNNEFVGFHTSESDSVSRIRALRLLRFGQWARSTRLAQLSDALRSRLRDTRPADEVSWDMAFFRKRRLALADPRRRLLYENFRTTLAGICQVVHRSGAQLILSTVAVNLKDCPPFGSLRPVNHAPQDQAAWLEQYRGGCETEEQGDTLRAIGLFQSAERIDNTCAELEFRLARCCLAAGQNSEARAHFILARDSDALQFRADSQINAIIRQFASEHRASGLQLANVEEALAACSPAGVPGNQLFQDHVHFRFAGDYQVAKALWPAVQAALGLEIPARQIPSEEECAALLAYTSWDELTVTRPMIELKSKPPFLDQIDHARTQAKDERQYEQSMRAFNRVQFQHAAELYRQAVAHRPNDWQLRYNFGYLLESFGDFTLAEEQFGRALVLYPRLFPAQLEIGFTYLSAGRTNQAIQQFIDSVRTDPHSTRAWRALAQALRK